MKKGWGADLSQIAPGVVHIWHGTADKSVDVSNAHKLAESIPGAQLRTFEGEGHLFVLKHLSELGELLAS